MEEKIKEIMEMVGRVEELSCDWQICVEGGFNPIHIEQDIKDATIAIEAALKSLAKNERKFGFDDAMAMMRISSD